MDYSFLATQGLRISLIYTKLVEVAESARPKWERKEMHDCYPLPKVPATLTPQLDSIMKPEASAATKAADKQLAKVQTVQTLLQKIYNNLAHYSKGTRVA